jgi:hypothetical protein
MANGLKTGFSADNTKKCLDGIAMKVFISLYVTPEAYPKWLRIFHVIEWPLTLNRSKIGNGMSALFTMRL